jgi:hypothetical protein
MKRLEPLLVLPSLAGMLFLLASAGAVLDVGQVEESQRPARLIRTMELSELPSPLEAMPGRPPLTRGVRARKS